MKRIVWTFGLIAGGFMAVMRAIAIAFQDQIADKGEIVRYSTMILAFLMVYFGIRAYRDNEMPGTIGFGRAFKVGILIALVASACYIAAWETIYHTVAQDFVEKFAARTIEKAKASGASAAEIEVQQEKMAKFVVVYKNPLVNVGLTFLEVFPVGVVVVLASAGILSRRKPQAAFDAERT
jgi:hypothetical protein